MKNSFVPVAARRGRLGAALLQSSSLGLALTQPAQAQQPVSPAGVEKMSDFSYRVWASNPAAQPGRLQLLNAATGTLLYEEYSSKVSFGRKFNVRDLPDGQYAFVVKLGKQQYRYTLNLHTTSQRSAELSAAATPTGRHLATAL